MQNVAFTAKHVIDSGGRIYHNQEKVTFDFVSLASMLCSFLSIDLVLVPETAQQFTESEDRIFNSLTPVLSHIKVP
ncbi:hypothetical protein RRG08_035169 [Elysia crispata]|uniref:Uncharacterized protein n=1 Tax=Elysia crispata TaxID=231223 RepID=A0AAE1ECY0_9GAST|nr:hypothetical protein RRG08_035169 [Elysia crispata]